MKIIYSSDEFTAEEGHCIFLAGPTPRSPDVKSWRIDAIAHLEDMGYSGTVYVPERKDWSVKFDYLDQVEWEYKGLMHVILQMLFLCED